MKNSQSQNTCLICLSTVDILGVFSWTYMVSFMASRYGSGYSPINLIKLKVVDH